MYPSLTDRDIGTALTWLEEAFGFESQILDDDDGGALARYGSGTTLIQLERPDELHGSHTGQGWVYVVIDDIDAHCRRAKLAGALLLGEPHDYGDGYRGYSARDLEGNSGASAHRAGSAVGDPRRSRAAVPCTGGDSRGSHAMRSSTGRLDVEVRRRG